MTASLAAHSVWYHWRDHVMLASPIPAPRVEPSEKLAALAIPGHVVFGSCARADGER
jgi:hypothetical protein